MPLCQSPYFRLEMLAAKTAQINQDTHGESCHALTVIEGSVRLIAGSEVVQLDRFQSALVPAAARQYRLEPVTSYRLLKAQPK